MASSGNFNTNGYEGRSLQFSWSTKNSLQDRIETNKTTIAWSLKGAGNANSAWYLAGNFKLVIAGSTVYSSVNRIRLYNGTTVASGEFTFVHDSNGEKTFEVYMEAGIYLVAVNCTGSAKFTLDKIPRASQPSCITWPEHTQNVGEFGDTIAIHMNRNSDIFTHTVRYAFGDLTGAIATGVTTGTTWKIPASFMDLLPGTTKGSGTIYVDTYQGSTLVGTKYCGFTATVPSSVKPTVSFTLEDVSGVDDIYGSPVQGLSRIKVTTKITQAYSSPIAAHTISINGINYNATEVTTGALLQAGDSEVTVTVKDLRGRTGSASYTMNVQAYTAPNVSALTVRRCNADGTANDQGLYVQVVFSAAISGMGGKNTAAYKLRYKKSTVSTYTEVGFKDSTTLYTVTDRAYIFAADESSSYDIEVTATDRHSTSARATSASTAFSLMDWHPSGTGVRWGGVAELDYTFQNDLELKQVGNSYAYQPGAFNGEKGYTLLAVITLKALNVNAPIVFELNRRGAICPMRVYARFASSSETLDPDLGSFSYEGDNYGAFLVRTAESTWKLYVDNTGGWSNPCLQRWFTTSNQMARIAVDFPSEQVAVLPTPYYRATPVVSRSILDCFMPVGFVLTLYSQADPNTMYPGTTWTRITNAFLWAVDEKGTIGTTGGAKEVTLTIDQIPSHSHGSVYSQHATGTKDKAWYNTSGSSVAYGTVATGGGEAHNNMPPYVQVSIWRRTA